METWIFEDVIGRLGSDDASVLKGIHALKAKDVTDIASALSQAFPANVSAKNLPFSYAANETLSGGPFPCMADECRQSKIDEASAFASLYADHVLIQDPFERVLDFKANRKEELGIAIRQTQRLLPLIRAGLVSFAQQKVPLCADCLNRLYENNMEGIARLRSGFAGRLGDAIRTNCKFYAGRHRDGDGFIRLQGPEDIVPHGSLYFPIPRTEKSRLAEIFAKRTPRRISKRDVDRFGLLGLIGRPVSLDLFRLEFSAKLHGANILCDNEFQLRTALKNTDAAVDLSMFHDVIRHEMPVLLDVPIDDVIKLRTHETDAFVVYRDRLTAIAKSSSNWTAETLREAFADTVRPEIARIERVVQNHRRTKKKALAAKAISTSAIVALGTFSGLLPSEFSTGIAALGGLAGAATCLGDVSTIREAPESAKSNDMYFLWKLTH